MSTKALAKSYLDEYNKIKKRKSVWMECPTGWFHTYNKEIIKMKLEQLWNSYTYFQRGN